MHKSKILKNKKISKLEKQIKELSAKVKYLEDVLKINEIGQLFLFNVNTYLNK